MQSCLTGIEKVKKSEKKSESCACDVLVRYVLGVSKKRVVSYNLSLLAYKHVLHKSLCSWPACVKIKPGFYPRLYGKQGTNSPGGEQIHGLEKSCTQGKGSRGTNSLLHRAQICLRIFSHIFLFWSGPGCWHKVSNLEYFQQAWHYFPAVSCIFHIVLCMNSMYCVYKRTTFAEWAHVHVHVEQAATSREHSTVSK